MFSHSVSPTTRVRARVFLVLNVHTPTLGNLRRVFPPFPIVCYDPRASTRAAKGRGGGEEKRSPPSATHRETSRGERDTMQRSRIQTKSRWNGGRSEGKEKQRRKWLEGGEGKRKIHEKEKKLISWSCSLIQDRQMIVGGECVTGRLEGRESDEDKQSSMALQTLSRLRRRRF